MGRRETREKAMKFLYQIQIQKDDIEEQIDRFIVEYNIKEETDKEYMLNVVHGVIREQQALDQLISRHLKGWTIGRIPKVDLAIIRLSSYEMKFREDIPNNVSINEAVEMAKKYCDDQSKAFINGVLGKIHVELQENQN